jgi:hypothetical protein
MSVKIDVLFRAGRWEARKCGEAGRVFGDSREEARMRAQTWRSEHHWLPRGAQARQAQVAGLLRDALRK